jgi:hypothetical protein
MTAERPDERACANLGGCQYRPADPWTDRSAGRKEVDLRLGMKVPPHANRNHDADVQRQDNKER